LREGLTRNKDIARAWESSGLGKAYSAERVEAAAARALACDGISYKSMNSILKNGLDQVPLSDEAPPEALPAHRNVRGPGYFR